MKLKPHEARSLNNLLALQIRCLDGLHITDQVKRDLDMMNFDDGFDEFIENFAPALTEQFEPLHQFLHGIQAILAHDQNTDGDTDDRLIITVLGLREKFVPYLDPTGAFSIATGVDTEVLKMIDARLHSPNEDTDDDLER